MAFIRDELPTFDCEVGCEKGISDLESSIAAKATAILSITRGSATLTGGNYMVNTSRHITPNGIYTDKVRIRLDNSISCIEVTTSPIGDMRLMSVNLTFDGQENCSDFQFLKWTDIRLDNVLFMAEEYRKKQEEERLDRRDGIMRAVECMLKTVHQPVSQVASQTLIFA